MAPVRFVYMTNPAAVPTMPNTTNIAKALDLGGGGALSFGGISSFISDDNFDLPRLPYYDKGTIVSTGTLETNNEGGDLVSIRDDMRTRKKKNNLSPSMSTRLKVDTIRD